MGILLRRLAEQGCGLWPQSRHRARRSIASLGGPAFVVLLLALTAWTQGPPELRACRQPLLSFGAPPLHTPQGAANRLRQKVNFRIPWIHRKFLSFFGTPFKQLGLFGWSDYCAEAEATGQVIHADRSADGYYTVDLALADFRVADEPTRLDGRRFVRIEIPGRVRKRTARLPRVGELMRIRGELMWDADGFLEIHPRAPEQIRCLSLEGIAAGAHK